MEVEDGRIACRSTSAERPLGREPADDSKVTYTAATARGRREVDPMAQGLWLFVQFAFVALAIVVVFRAFGGLSWGETLVALVVVAVLLTALKRVRARDGRQKR